MKTLMLSIINIAQQAGEKILQCYRDTSTAVTYKADASPVTMADKLSHQLVCQALKQLTPNIPIISEEERVMPYVSEQALGECYWLVDPLDGTKDFLAKNGEFTVNIALIDKQVPQLGVIYVPVFDCSYFAEANGAAFKQNGRNTPQLLKTRDWEQSISPVMAISRRHGTARLKNFFKQFPALNLIRCGSALKFCWMAEGYIDMDPRFAPTSQWDTAAGQCILEAAGGRVFNRQGQSLGYKAGFSMLNEYFLAVGDKKYPYWHDYFSKIS